MMKCRADLSQQHYRGDFDVTKMFYLKIDEVIADRKRENPSCKRLI